MSSTVLSVEGATDLICIPPFILQFFFSKPLHFSKILPSDFSNNLTAIVVIFCVW